MGSEPNTFDAPDAQPCHKLSTRSTKQLYRTLAKLVLGVSLLYYVLSSGMIDFRSLGPALFAPKFLITSLLFLSLSATVCSMRWYQLARVQGLTVSFRQIFELTMIGNFFNTFLPGSVGGDLIKAWYIAGHSINGKTRGVFTVLLDRMIGLSVIIFYAALTLPFFLDLLENQHRLKVIGYALWAFTGVAAIGAIFFFTPFIWNIAWFAKSIQFLERLGPLGRIVQAASLYRHHLRTVLIATLLSAASVFGVTILYSVHGHNMGIPLSTGYYFFVVPIGVVASAVPLLPGGIGVGQVAFFTLFRWVGETPEYGGTLCTLLQLHTILFNCAGLFFYLKHKNKTRAYSVPVPL